MFVPEEPLVISVMSTDGIDNEVPASRAGDTAVIVKSSVDADVNRGQAISGTGSSYDMGCYENQCTARAGPFYVNDGFTSGDVYTSAIGSDLNNITGSVSTPFATLKKAINQCGCAGGTTIYVDAGTYGEDDLTVAVFEHPVLAV